MKNIIFSNVLGSFVFSDHFALVDSIEFKTREQYLEREKTETELITRHHAHKPTEAQLRHILSHFKKKEYLKRFGEMNLLLTKQAIKDSVAKDGIVIQTISAIEELEKVLNLMTKRMREWYGLYNPELENRLDHHESFLEATQKHEKLDENTLGGKLDQKDIDQLLHFGKKLSELYSVKSELEKYLETLEQELCPNLAALAGPTIVAKLISHAGSMKRLAEMPASTLQVLGAEKALFRHLRNKKNLPPKHGVIHEHPLISKSSPNEHGKIARALADKLSMAARIDFYKGEYIGEKLKKELIEKVGIGY